MKRWMNAVYSLLFVALLLLPLVTMNFKTNQISEIDNDNLPELKLQMDGLLTNIEEYVNKRIGFRSETLNFYQRMNDELFGIMEHPQYMYGEDGHVFFSMDSYISDYQNLNLDPEWAEGFAADMQAFSDAAEERGAEFFYMLIPDKKTVYSESFPEEIHVRGDVSRTDQVLEALSRTDVRWLYVNDVMQEGKKTMKVCNLLYDAGHWNENGAFLCYQELYELLRRVHPEIEPLQAEDFSVTSKVEESLSVSRFEIHDEVPVYTLRESNAVSDLEWLEQNLFFPEPSVVHTRYVNPQAADKPSLLVLHDSYMNGHERFFTENFSEVTFIHRRNLYNIEVYEAYLDRISPDIVIFENPERTFPITFDKKYKIPA